MSCIRLKSGVRLNISEESFKDKYFMKRLKKEVTHQPYESSTRLPKSIKRTDTKLTSPYGE